MEKEKGQEAPFLALACCSKAGKMGSGNPKNADVVGVGPEGPWPFSRQVTLVLDTVTERCGRRSC